MKKIWELKLRTLRQLGVFEAQLRLSPAVLALRVKKIEEVKLVLLEMGKYDISILSDALYHLLSVSKSGINYKSMF